MRERGRGRESDKKRIQRGSFSGKKKNFSDSFDDDDDPLRRKEEKDKVKIWLVFIFGFVSTV